MAIYKNVLVTEQFLNNNKNCFFVFGDNLMQSGYGGAAMLRDHPQSIGFVTKKAPDNRNESFYTPDEYYPLFKKQLEYLKRIISCRNDNIFYISQLGAGLANRYNIWETVIKTNLETELGDLENVVFCWNK